jgi:hypothetical protein
MVSLSNHSGIRKITLRQAQGERVHITLGFLKGEKIESYFNAFPLW